VHQGRYFTTYKSAARGLSAGRRVVKVNEWRLDQSSMGA
jgi:hypothetical protein